MFSNARQLRLTEEYIDAHFDELVDRVVRASVSGEHFVVVWLWLYAARRAYETRNLEQLAKLLRSGVPHSRQVDQMLADMFGLCKLMRKKKGGQRKLFGMSAAAQNVQAERTVRRLMTGEIKLINELSTKELVWKDPSGSPLRVRSRAGLLRMNSEVRLLEVDAKFAPAWDAEARKLSKLRDARGRMPRPRAIELTARALSDRREGYPPLKEDKLERWVIGTTGARQRHRTAQKKRPPT
jgi:hypothetical protein